MDGSRGKRFSRRSMVRPGPRVAPGYLAARRRQYMLNVADGSESEPAAAGRGRISLQALRHNQMRRAIVRAHPEAADLAGPNPLSVLAIPVLLAIHWSLAWLVSGTGLLTVFVVAFLLGQLVIHAAGALLHETTHRLVFRGSAAKLAFDIGLEIIMGSFAKQLTYQHEHLTSHHP